MEYVSRRREGERTSEGGYAFTSLVASEAGPERLARLWQGHWQIENGLHGVRDVTLGEDACQVCCDHAPKTLTTVRPIVVSLIRLAGYPHVAAAQRHQQWHPQTVLTLLGLQLA